MCKIIDRQIKIDVYKWIDKLIYIYINKWLNNLEGVEARNLCLKYFSLIWCSKLNQVGYIFIFCTKNNAGPFFKA